MLDNECKVLTDSQLARVHSLTLEVLEKKGVLFHDEESPGILARHGMHVEGHCARFPAGKVDAALGMCPPHFMWHARDPKKSLLVGEGQDRLFVMQDHGPVYVQEHGGKRRHGSLEDVVNFYKLGQSSKVTSIVGQCTVDPHELDELPNKHKLVTRELLRHTDKPILSWPQMTDRATRDIFEMVEMVMGRGFLANHHFLTASVCALSPLQYAGESAATIIAYARANQPVMLLTAPMNGVSAPIGDIPSLVMQNAEILAGLVLAQCVTPGIPVIYGIGTYAADLRTGAFVTGSPDSKLVDRAALQLAQTLYHLPTRFMAGNTDAKIPDIQAGYETMQNYMLLLLGGAQMINECLGILDGMVSVSYEKYIIDEEMLRRIDRIIRGLDTSEEAFDISEILESPHGESFLVSQKTLDACGRQWTPDVAFWKNYHSFVEEGEPDILEKAASICAERLAGAPSSLLENKLDRELAEFAAR